MQNTAYHSRASLSTGRQCCLAHLARCHVLVVTKVPTAIVMSPTLSPPSPRPRDCPNLLADQRVRRCRHEDVHLLVAALGILDLSSPSASEPTPTPLPTPVLHHVLRRRYAKWNRNSPPNAALKLRCSAAAPAHFFLEFLFGETTRGRREAGTSHRDRRGDSHTTGLLSTWAPHTRRLTGGKPRAGLSGKQEQVCKLSRTYIHTYVTICAPSCEILRRIRARLQNVAKVRVGF